MITTREIDAAYQDLSYAGNGPVTRFVAIHAALAEVKRGRHSVDALAEALAILLDDIRASGPIPSSEY